MIVSVRQIKNRIRSIKNVEKVTSAIEMISAIKLKRADKALFGFRQYLTALESILADLANSRENLSHAYFRQSNLPGKNILLCLITSDTGLCGLYNHNLLHEASLFIEQEGRGNISLVLVGKKGINHFRSRGLKILQSYSGLNAAYKPAVSDEIAAMLSNLFLAGRAGRVYVASTYFKNAFVQTAGVRKFLNIELPAAGWRDYIIEQPFTGLLEKISQAYLVTKMRTIFLEAFSSEHAARHLAMKMASDNAEELIDGLNLAKNKLRQANITREIAEIISSVEVLKG